MCSPLSLLYTARQKRYRSNEYKRQYKNFWTRLFLCYPCLIKGISANSSSQNFLYYILIMSYIYNFIKQKINIATWIIISYVSVGEERSIFVPTRCQTAVPSVCRETPVSAVKISWTSNKPAKWTLSVYVHTRILVYTVHIYVRILISLCASHQFHFMRLSKVIPEGKVRSVTVLC
jgi:hypothetical protein